MGAPGEHVRTLVDVPGIVGEQMEVEESLYFPLLRVLNQHGSLAAECSRQNHYGGEQQLPGKPAVLSVLLQRAQHDLIDEQLLVGSGQGFALRRDRLLLNCK